MSTDERIEHDAWGDIPVPGDHLWGAQTQRSIEHFAISTERMPPELLHALALVKSAAARVNQRTASVDCEGGTSWRVPFAMLRHVMDI